MIFKPFSIFLAIIGTSATLSIYGSDLNRQLPIEDIRIEGLTALTRNMLPALPSFNSKLGQKVVESSVYYDVNMLYLTGHFKSVKAVTRPTGARTLLVFEVEENPTINSVVFQGESNEFALQIRERLPFRILGPTGLSKGIVLKA
ncbi:hypothetical protein EBR96_02190 [bacterium]|nr:hypothetical protein [bacterium]